MLSVGCEWSCRSVTANFSQCRGSSPLNGESRSWVQSEQGLATIGEDSQL